MRKDLMSRDEVIARVGLSAVDAVDMKNCEVSPGECPDWEDMQPFNATLWCVDENGQEVKLSAIYYQRREDLDKPDDQLEWKIAGYEIED